LKEEFSDYLLIANYNFERNSRRLVVLAIYRKGFIPGIKGNVDVNIYNGDLQQLRFITVGNFLVASIIYLLRFLILASD
jgi:lysozyme